VTLGVAWAVRRAMRGRTPDLPPGRIPEA